MRIKFHGLGFASPPTAHGPRFPPPRDTVGTMTDANPPHDIPRRLDAARQDLLELSTRNRLLSTPRHAKRARALEVVDEKSDELYRLLIEGGASLTFLEASEKTLAEQAEAAAAEAAREAERTAEPAAGRFRRHTGQRRRRRRGPCD